MKRLLLPVLFLLSIGGAFAQKIAFGGFGHFFTGIAYSDVSRLNSYLQAADVLGNNTGFRSSGMIIGGQGFAIFNGNFLIGGNGYAVNLGKNRYVNGDAVLSSAGGCFNFGYATVRDCDKLLYFYGGIGASSLVADIDNTGDTLVYFDKGRAVKPGEQRTYQLPGMDYELAVGFKKIFGKKECTKDLIDNGGILVGLDAGVHYTLALSGWEKISGPPDFDPVIWFVRITIGGGGFGLAEK